MQAPVVLFVYNRLEHTKKVLEALNCNVGVEKTVLYIFSDAPSSEIEVENVKKVREYVKIFKEKSFLKEIIIIEAEENKGLEKSIIGGITEIINKYGQVIVLEDDIVTAPDFLEFMNQALEYYKNDNKIWSISGYNINTPRIKRGKRDVYIGYRGECWGWASWADRWNRVDWNVSDYKDFLKNKYLQRAFNKGGSDMSSMLKMQQEGLIKSWAIRWCYQQFKEGMFTIFPKNSKIMNIGFDGSGTNCSKQSERECQFVVDNKWDFKYNLQDKLVSNEFRKSYFISYARQMLGRYWYLLTEYEYCLAYRRNEAENYKILKPNFKEWYADPIPFEWKGQTYVFVEAYDKFLQKGYIGLCTFYNKGELSKPKKIIEEPFHMSFPNIFEYKGDIYMFPECSEVEQIRVYKMGTDILEWKPYHVFEGVGKIVDSAILVNDEKKMYLLGSEINSQNPYQSRLMLFEIKNLEKKDKVQLCKLWEEKEYSYTTRNGGNFMLIDGEMYRIVQHSTKDIYGKYVTLKKMVKMNADGIEEVHSKKIDINNQDINLTPFIYRVWGIHTYGKIEQVQIIDLLVQRFSMGGLFVKFYRRLKKCKLEDIRIMQKI